MYAFTTGATAAPFFWLLVCYPSRKALRSRKDLVSNRRTSKWATLQRESTALVKRLTQVKKGE